MGGAIICICADVKLRSAPVKTSRALLCLNALKPGNEAMYM